MEKVEAIQFIRKHLSKTAIMLQLHEESAELISTGAKLARATGAVFNPTPVSEDAAADNFEEEIIDTMNALWALGYSPDYIAELVKSDENTKLDRWVERIEKELI